MQRGLLMKEYNTLDDFDVKNKTILLRVDFNLPLDKKTLNILDTTRIKLTIPTIKELIEKKAKVVILAHQGRKGDWDFTSLANHAKSLQKILKKPVTFVEDIFGKKAQNAIQAMRQGDVVMLDNVRKFKGETEKKSAEDHSKSPLVQNLAPLAELFVNDAFSAAHRAQCSLIGFTVVLPSCAGRLMEKELNLLGRMLKTPEKPCIFLFGGTKFSDIVVTIDRVLSNKIADKVLLTGLPAHAFLKSKGYSLGIKNEELLMREGSPRQFIEMEKIIKKYKNKIFLPIDFAIAQSGKRKEIDLDVLPCEEYLSDIGEKTIYQFKHMLTNAKTIFFSGPCGVFENKLFRKGTREIFITIAESGSFSIAGGGHTIAAIDQLKIQNKISHISSGGGSLEKFIMGENLVVVEALKNAKDRIFIE